LKIILGQGIATAVPFIFADNRIIKPFKASQHLTNMQVRTALLALIVSVIPIGLAGCNACASKPSTPEQVRQQTAAATAELKDNAKAIAQGIRDGLTRPSPDKPVDLNTASKGQLMGLPGIDDASAERIITGRPYSSEHELLERRILSREQYNKIADSITIKK
jgi:hypothetical protein